MKPKFVKEVDRVIQTFKNAYISDLSKAHFKVLVDNSNVWHDLAIIATNDFQKAVCYVLDGQKYNNVEDQSWPNALLQATNRSCFDWEHLREFVLKDDCYQLVHEYKPKIKTNKIHLSNPQNESNQCADLLLLICKTAAIITITASLVGLVVASVVLTGGLAALGMAAFSATTILGVVGFYKVKAEKERLELPDDCTPCFI